MPETSSTDQMRLDVMKRPATRETNEADKFVGERIRLYRSMLGMSQQKLAERLSITFQQLQKYERGENRIGAGRLLMVATTLGIPITFLLDHQAFLRQQAGDSLSELEIPVAAREAYHVGRAFSQIADPEIRRSISTLVRSLARDESDA